MDGELDEEQKKNFVKYLKSASVFVGHGAGCLYDEWEALPRDEDAPKPTRPAEFDCTCGVVKTIPLR